MLEQVLKGSCPMLTVGYLHKAWLDLLKLDMKKITYIYKQLIYLSIKG